MRDPRCLLKHKWNEPEVSFTYQYDWFARTFGNTLLTRKCVLCGKRKSDAFYTPDAY